MYCLKEGADVNARGQVWQLCAIFLEILSPQALSIFLYRHEHYTVGKALERLLLH
jgi:hypothetical protein